MCSCAFDWSFVFSVGDNAVRNGPLARYNKLRVAHAPGMTGTRFCDLDTHHGTRVMRVPWCMSGSLTSGFLWGRWRRKRSRYSRRMRNLPFYLSGKRPVMIMISWLHTILDLPLIGAALWPRGVPNWHIHTIDVKEVIELSVEFVSLNIPKIYRPRQ